MIEVETVRHGAGWFRLPSRGLIAVRGADRVRFLNGQLTQDVAALEAAGPGAGGYSFLLTPKGRIVADLHVIVTAEEVLLECDRARIAAAMERLDRYLVADDVTLCDESARWARFAIEGPNAHAVLPELPPLSPGHSAEVEIAGVPVRVIAYGWSSFPARQLLVPTDKADSVETALLERGLRHSMVPASADTLEMLRIEAGTPGLEELDEDVLPAETGVLERAVSFEKGCYTGQEVVARMASRDRLAHRLVGLTRSVGGEAFSPGMTLFVGGRKVGEITSAVQSSQHGAIALAFVRNAHCEDGAVLDLETEAGAAQLLLLPFRKG